MNHQTEANGEGTYLRRANQDGFLLSTALITNERATVEAAQLMTSRQYKLSLGDGAYGPGDIQETTVVDEGDIRGPKLPDWQAQYILVRCIFPTTYRRSGANVPSFGPSL